MAIIRLPTPLRPFAGGLAEIPVDGSTVSQALDCLVERYPALRNHLLDSRGDLRPYVNLFLGEENVFDLGGLETSIAEGDRLLLIPSIAGG
jgi:molybdopterin converting factor small subunit